jgi:hypothetical protein
LVGTIAVTELAICVKTLAYAATLLLVLATDPTVSETTHRFLYDAPPADRPGTG